MKESGMVRRVDDLGRLVIPIEIRKNLGIKTGDEIEMFLNEENIVLKKFSKLKEKELILKEYVNCLFPGFKLVAVTDKERVIYNKSLNGEILDGQILSKSLKKQMDKINPSVVDDILKISENEINNYNYTFVKPICVGGDLYGALIVKNDKLFDQNEIGKIDIISELIQNQI